MIARKPGRTPKFRHHKATGQGFVELNGRRLYLGRHDRPQTLERYHQKIAEWLANGRRLPVPPDDITVVELCARFWEHAKVYYRKPDGSPTSSLHVYRMAIRPLRELYGRSRAVEFGPCGLKTVRHRMIELGWSRGTVNQMVNLIRAVFRWAVAEELIPADVHTALLAVAPLRQGRSQARDTAPVTPVPEAHIEAVQPHVTPQVWALIQLQLLTGARAGELVLMRPIDLDTTGKVWLFRPKTHKTAHHGRDRTIYLGPQAQQIVRQFLAAKPANSYLFSPREGMAHRRATGATKRRRSGQPPTPRKTDRMMGRRYTTESHRRAIERACRIAGVARWSPHQLRHNAATTIRKQYGVEAAQLLLGHSRADVTQVYAEVNHDKARDIAARFG